MKLIIGNRAYSSWSMRGWLAMKHSDVEFEELVVPMFDEAWEKRREGDEFAPSLGKVPILWDGDCVVWDSLAIIEFLADRVGRDRFWPAADAARGMARSMAAEMHSGFSNLRRDLPMNVRKSYPPKELSDEVTEEIGARTVGHVGAFFQRDVGVAPAGHDDVHAGLLAQQHLQPLRDVQHQASLGEALDHRSRVVPSMAGVDDHARHAEPQLA